jgi:hypothetical protein
MPRKLPAPRVVDDECPPTVRTGFPPPKPQEPQLDLFPGVDDLGER